MSAMIVIGAGVNGLSCALTLAQAGKKVIVVERRAELGGLSGRRSFGEGFQVPGMRHDTCEIRPELAADLGLAAHGLTLLSEGEPVFASDDSTGLLLHADPEKSRNELEKRSKKDANAYAAFRQFMGRLRPVLAPLLGKNPPPLVPAKWSETLNLGMLGLKLRGLGPKDMVETMRAAPMCVADLLREMFETELLSATLAFPAVVGDFVGPWSPGTAAMLLLREAMLVPGVKGGPAAVVDALAKAAKAAGVEIRTGVSVAEIAMKGGRVAGVRFEKGETLEAAALIAACSPRHVMNDLLPPLSLEMKDQAAARTMRTRGTAAKVHLGLSAKPSWRGRPGEAFARVRVGGAHLDDLERTFDATKYKELPGAPVLDIVHSSENGKDSLSILLAAVPYDLTGGWTTAAKATLLERTLKVLEKHATSIRDQIVSSEVLSPVDIESEYGATGGSMNHVERALDQMVFMRPARPFAQFATPIEGLFVGSSGCHPGPGVTLAPGVLAARAALGQ